MRKKQNRKTRPSRMYAAFRLAKMLHKVDGMAYGMALAIAIYHVTWDYDNWTDEDHVWFWENLRNDEKFIPV